MTLFTNKEIHHVIFANEQHDLIEVLFNNTEAGSEKADEVISYYVPALNPDNEDLKELQSLGYGFEEIFDETVAWNMSEAEAFKQIYRHFAQEEVAELDKKYQNEISQLKSGIEESGKNLITAIMNMNTDVDILMEAKLAVFDMELAKDNKDLKSDIRRAKTLLALISLVNENTK